MRKEKVAFELSIFDSSDELSSEEQRLMQEAVRAREDAYAPYSGFKVGAAVLMENGRVVIGNNQENASYPSGLCAERVAVYQAGALYPGLEIRAIAVSAAASTGKKTQPAAPCGNCRQAIAEYEQRQEAGIRILMSGDTGTVYKCGSVADLLPLAFGRSYLE